MTKEKKEEVMEGVLKVLETFPFYRHAARINGISEDTLRVWRDEDPELSARVEASRSRGIMNYARKADPSFMLASAEPETFGKRLDITSGGEKIEGITIQYITPDATDSSTTDDKTA